MSFSFTIDRAPLPSFLEIVAAADLGEPVQLAGAGWTGEGWPKGLYAKISDAAATPTSMELTPEIEATLARAGISGSFLAFVQGCARGVEVAKTQTGIAFRVLALSSAEDYALAVRLAAATARLVKAQVQAEHGSDGAPVPPASPDDLLARFDAKFADLNARQMGTWLAEDIAQERTYYFQGPRGFVKLGPDDLAAVPKEQRFDAALAALRGEPPSITHATDARRDAVLLTAAMAFAAAADGKLDDAEARQLEAHFQTVRELSTHPAKELLESARAEVKSIDELRTLSSAGLRRKAFVLAAEVIASAQHGAITGDPKDPNVKAIASLAKALDVEKEPVFIAQVVRTVFAKYAPSAGADDTLARALVGGMLLAAAADGHVDAQEAAVLAGLAMTVPELKTRDFHELVDGATKRMSEGPAVAFGELGKLDASRNKAFALVAEVALVAGKGESGTLLPKLREVIAPDPDVADGAVATFAAKYC